MATTSKPIFRQTYIYGICDDTGEVRYIGKSYDVENRFRDHIREKHKTYPLYNWLRKQIVEGKEVTCVTLASTLTSWQLLEKDMISQYRKSNPNMLNLADGGDQPKCTAEQYRASGYRLTCPVEIRRENGRKVSAAIQADPLKKRIHYLKLHLTKALNKGLLSEEVKNKLRTAASKRPDLFALWKNI